MGPQSEPQQALDWLQKGGLALGPEWEQAHEICQRAEGRRDHDLVHALCHWIEGDVANCNYWYARVAPWVRAFSIAEEWVAVRTTVA